MKEHIFVALSTFAKCGAEPLELLEQSGHPFTINSTGKRLTKEQLIDSAQEAVGIVAGLEPYDSDVLNALSNLKCISRCGVGIDNIDLEQAKNKAVQVCNTPDVVIQPVAELTIAMAFDLLRRLTAHSALVKAGRWERLQGNNLSGKTIGLIGLGRIGKRVAQMFHVLGAKVIATDIHPDNEWMSQNNVECVAFEDLLKQSDIVSIHLAHVVDNPFVLNKIHFEMMPKGSMLINVARGQFVDEDDLYDALQSAHLSGAALDVYREEPYKGKLGECENIVFTPHVATLTFESRTQMEYEAVANCINTFK